MTDEVTHTTEDDEALASALDSLRHELDVELPEKEELLDSEPQAIEVPEAPLGGVIPGIFGKGVDYDPSKMPSQKRLAGTLIIVGVIILAVAGFILYNAVFAPLVKVPDLIGKSSTEAIKALSEKGLTLGTLTEKETSGIADGIVLDQNPRVDSQMRKGSKVSLTVSKSGDTTIVPGLTGHTLLEAQRLLTDKRLAINTVTTFNDATPKGAIVGQLPVADTVVPATSRVTVLVSAGPYKNSLVNPRVIGLSEDEAVKILKNKGLTPMVSYATTAFGNVGEVVMQTPASQSALSPKSVVQILVSKDLGGEKAQVPDVVGMTQKDAEKKLVNAGFSIDSRLTVDPSMPKGSVSAQTPGSKDTLLRPGETVSLLISQGPSSSVVVPNVLNATVNQAQDELEALGFEVIVVSNSTIQNSNNAVSQQFPAGQSAYNLGLPVLLYAPAQGQ